MKNKKIIIPLIILIVVLVLVFVFFDKIEKIFDINNKNYIIYKDSNIGELEYSGVGDIE
jgi:uncharacterized membrane protein YkvI